MTPVALVTDTVPVQTRGDSHVLDLTPQVQELLERRRLRSGQAALAPRGRPYAHEEHPREGRRQLTALPS